MKREMRGHNSHMQPELESPLESAWRDIRLRNRAQPLIDSMPRRIAAVIRDGS